MTSYKELLKQRDALEQQIQEARTRELADAVGKVRALVAEYGLTSEDIFAPARASRTASTSGNKVAPKYKNPETGETWTGRGKAPKWIQDQDRSKFVI
ncbi:MAG: H-NS histone family protein [Comamonas sp.]|jgi:DNA-binding protein H-NS|nr:H-NS histone family protein [Comamonas sp.]